MLLIETNVLLSAADISDQDHIGCATVLDQRTDIAVPAPVTAETAWMLDARLGSTAEIAFVGAIASGEIPVVDLTTSDWQRCRDLIETYADLHLGIVDASVVAVAERLGLSEIATLNHRDFHVVRPRHVGAVNLLPVR
jgi:predicted nucleic acid-binding protein